MGQIGYFQNKLRHPRRQNRARIRANLNARVAVSMVTLSVSREARVNCAVQFESEREVQFYSK